MTRLPLISQSISGEINHAQDVNVVALITIVDGISKGVCWQSSLNMAQRGTVVRAVCLSSIVQAERSVTCDVVGTCIILNGRAENS